MYSNEASQDLDLSVSMVIDFALIPFDKEYDRFRGDTYIDLVWTPNCKAVRQEGGIPHISAFPLEHRQRDM